MRILKREKVTKMAIGLEKAWKAREHLGHHRPRDRGLQESVAD